MRKIKNDDILINLHEYGINLESREIWLDSSSEEINTKTAVQFEKNLLLLERVSNKPITIHLHSPGGSWYDGLGIYDVIVNAKSNVTIVVHSMAASTASVILQAGDRRILMPNSHVMIHHGTLGIDSTLKSAIGYINKAKQDMKKMISIYSNKCINGEFFSGKTIKDVEKYIDQKLNEKEDWYLDAEQAVYYGFADGILGGKGFESIYI